MFPSAGCAAENLSERPAGGHVMLQVWFAVALCGVVWSRGSRAWGQSLQTHEMEPSAVFALKQKTEGPD